jgi:hypothetical protein
MEVRAEQPKKQSLPKEVTVFPIVTLINEEPIGTEYEADVNIVSGLSEKVLLE